MSCYTLKVGYGDINEVNDVHSNNYWFSIIIKLQSFKCILQYTTSLKSGYSEKMKQFCMLHSKVMIIDKPSAQEHFSPNDTLLVVLHVQ